VPSPSAGVQNYSILRVNDMMHIAEVYRSSTTCDT